MKFSADERGSIPEDILEKYLAKYQLSSQSQATGLSVMGEALREHVRDLGRLPDELWKIQKIDWPRVMASFCLALWPEVPVPTVAKEGSAWCSIAGPLKRAIAGLRADGYYDNTLGNLVSIARCTQQQGFTGELAPLPADWDFGPRLSDLLSAFVEMEDVLSHQNRRGWLFTDAGRYAGKKHGRAAVAAIGVANFLREHSGVPQWSLVEKIIDVTYPGAIVDFSSVKRTAEKRRHTSKRTTGKRSLK